MSVDGGVHSHDLPVRLEMEATVGAAMRARPAQLATAWPR